MTATAVMRAVVAAAAIAVAAQSGFSAPLPAGPGFGTFATGRDPRIARIATMQNLRKAAAQECGGIVRVVALVDDSLSAGLLAQYGWRVITRIGTVATLQGCAATVPYLCALPGIRYVKMPSRVFPTMDSVRKIVHVNEVHKTVPGWSGPRLTGKGVLFGIIDTDFDTRHHAFLDSLGLTRFLALWDQDAAPTDGNRFGYGVIKNHAGILADSMFGLGSDGHGTLMASFGGGSDWASPYYGVAPDVIFAGVKMGGTDQTIIDGLHWIMSLADSLGMPCVLNMSLGIAEGPHDGTSLVDRAIDSVTAPGRIVVGAAGNDGVKQEHVGFALAAGQSAGTWAMTVPYTSPWYVSVIDMWGDSGTSIAATFYVIDSITKAFGEPTPRKRLDSRTSTTDANAQMVTWNTNQLYFQVTAAENASPLNGKPHLQTVMFSPNTHLFFGPMVSVPGTGGGTVHCWNVMQKAFRALSVSGRLDGDFTMSVNELGGTARRNITVGAYNSKLVTTNYLGNTIGYPPGDSSYHGISSYSGQGPTVDGRIKPDITAPGSNPAGALPRFIATNANCVWWPDSPAVEDRYMIAGGTSVSSPIVAGVVALMFEYDPTLTVEQARQLLQESALTDAATGTIPPYNNLWGAGKVNALGAVNRLINGTGVRPPIDVYYASAPAPRLVQLSGSRLKFTGSAKDAVVELFTLHGRRVMRSAAGGTVSLAGVPQGVYFARAAHNGKVICSRKVSIVR
jgi:minor extracellular serine protease Vpr